jgi:hypothetical protein
MLLIFIRVKRTFLLFSFDLILNLATKKQREKTTERMNEQKTSENERTKKERANKERANKKRANKRMKERLKTNERDYKRMQF